MSSVIFSSLRLNSDLRVKYRAFHAREFPIESFSVFMIMLTIYSIYNVIGLSHQEYAQGNIVYNISLILSFPALIIGWTCFYLKYKVKYDADGIDDPRLLYASIAQDVFAVAFSVFAGLRLYAKVNYGECRTDMYEEFHYCNMNAETRGLPEDNLLLVVLLPIVYASILRETNVSVMIVCWVVLLIALVVCINEINNFGSKSIIVVFYVTVPILTLYSNQKQNIRSFIVQQQLAAVIKQNEEMAVELRANELRHMIGNVAHDLKTPLASLVSGLDMIADIAQDGLNKLTVASAPAANTSSGSHTNSLMISSFSAPRSGLQAVNVNSLVEIQEWLQAVLHTVQNSRNINNFMMMTINRCIDYTKASKGLKLVPKFETIDLVDVLSLPFKCMRDVSRKVRINLEPLSKDICSHIITDKQWLQENILCLLSNAVKYSAGGTVNGRVSLTSAEEVSRLHAGSRAFGHVERLDEQLSVLTVSTSKASNWSISNRVKVHSMPESSYAYVPSNASTDELPNMRLRLKPQQKKDTVIIQHQQVILIEVDDTGIGLSDEDAASLFGAFKQAQRLAGGTGLGLFSLARRIEALGGAYGVKKRADQVQGSLFWFTIPYRPDEQFASLTKEGTSPSLDIDQTSKVMPQTAYKNSPKYHVKPLRILIVDDSASIQKMMSMMLRRHGHTVDQAENGAEAVQMVTSCYQQHGQGQTGGVEGQKSPSCSYDVVLMDLQMPVMDGLQAMRRIRQAEQEMRNSQRGGLVDEDAVQTFERDSSRKSRPSLHLDYNNSSKSNKQAKPSSDATTSLEVHQLILGVSANSDTETMEEALHAGADAFISKPFSIDSFYCTYQKCSQRMVQ